jgi:hypothetical protein
MYFLGFQKAFPKIGPPSPEVSPVFHPNMYGFSGSIGEKWVLHLDMLRCFGMRGRVLVR